MNRNDTGPLRFQDSAGGRNVKGGMGSGESRYRNDERATEICKAQELASVHPVVLTIGDLRSAQALGSMRASPIPSIT